VDGDAEPPHGTPPPGRGTARSEILAVQVRALVVSNMRADAAHPARGSFVRDQVAALRRLPITAAAGPWEIELFEFAPGPAALAAAFVALRRQHGGRPFDVVHAHFGLSAYPSLAVRARRRVLTVHGTDVRHPRTARLTRLVARRMDLLAAASASLGQEAGAAAVLPCGVDTERFRPVDRREARLALGLAPGAPCLLFPAAVDRPVKRFDRARALADLLEVPLLSAGEVPPERMPLLVNAANAVLVPSEQEGFGLAALEAIACEVPVIATPVGIHPVALGELEGAVCAPFEIASWRAALQALLADPDARVAGGRERAELFSSMRMAERVRLAWEEALELGEADGRA
jgi:teichuronic acid biosynthesis glycosyltransferase TuaC